MAARRALSIGLVLVAGVVGFVLGTFNQPATAGATTDAVEPFSAVAYASKVSEAWESRDTALLGSTLSELYNEVGLSKQEVLAKAEAMMQQYEDVQVNYRVLDFRQFPGTNLGSAKAVLQMLVRKAGEKEMTPVIETMGYASMIFEDGEWKVYGTQSFYSPDEPANFNFETVTTEWWPEWGTQLTQEEIQALQGGTR